MRRLAVLALALVCAACAYPGYGPPSAALLLSNPGPGHVAVEAVVTAYPDCNSRGGSVYAKSRFSLPPDGTRFIAAPPGASVCWRVVPAAGTAGAAEAEWNRTFLPSGALVDSSI